jgi:hypothetical protein
MQRGDCFVMLPNPNGGMNLGGADGDVETAGVMCCTA